MTSPSTRRPVAAALFLSLCFALPPVSAEGPAAPAKPMGELWEVTSQMSMEGMPMALPSRTVQVCSPKDWKEPPGAADDRHKCKNSDFKQEGSKVTWKMMCAGPPPMSGAGEITRESAETWNGAVKFAAQEAAMTLKLNGKRLGTCELPQ